MTTTRTYTQLTVRRCLAAVGRLVEAPAGPVVVEAVVLRLGAPAATPPTDVVGSGGAEHLQAPGGVRVVPAVRVGEVRLGGRLRAGDGRDGAQPHRGVVGGGVVAAGQPGPGAPGPRRQLGQRFGGVRRAIDPGAADQRPGAGVLGTAAARRGTGSASVTVRRKVRKRWPGCRSCQWKPCPSRGGVSVIASPRPQASPAAVALSMRPGTRCRRTG